MISVALPANIRRALLPLILCCVVSQSHAAEKLRLLHVSYDATREVFAEMNAAFARAYEAAHPGVRVSVRMSHGGSGAQTRAILDGLDADIASLALESDMEKLRAAGIADAATTPFHSAVVFLVRKDNPKRITGWADLAREEVEVIAPNPKSSGGARWNVAAAYLYATQHYGGDEKAIMDYLKRAFTRARVMDAAARGSTTSFVRRRIGDVLVTWESEAKLVAERFAEQGFEVVTPRPTLRADPSLSVLEGNCTRHRNCALARAYAAFIASPEGQEVARAHHLRTGKDEALTPIAALGGWGKVQQQLFADGALWDRLFIRGKDE